MLPRLIRFRDAPGYLGMDRKFFNKEVRPTLLEISIGKQGIAFDRLDLDAWAEQYISRNGRPNKKRSDIWDAKNHQVSIKEEIAGISTSKYSDKEYEKALDLVNSQKLNAT